MAGNNKRKWRWSSKGIFGPKASNNHLVRDRFAEYDPSGTASQSAAIDMSLDSFNSDEGPIASKKAFKICHNGSRLLSAVGIHRDSGELQSPELSSIDAES